MLSIFRDMLQIPDKMIVFHSCFYLQIRWMSKKLLAIYRSIANKEPPLYSRTFHSCLDLVLSLFSDNFLFRFEVILLDAPLVLCFSFYHRIIYLLKIRIKGRINRKRSKKEYLLTCVRYRNSLKPFSLFDSCANDISDLVSQSNGNGANLEASCSSNSLFPFGCL